MKTARNRLLALLAVLAMIVAACGGDDGGTDGTDAPDGDTDTTAAEGDMSMPGEGVTVRQGRANWSSGYFAAYVYTLLLEELGYEVTDPAETELAPSLAYLGMAQGDFDFWQESWMPGHLSWFANEMPDGSIVGDHLTVFATAGDAAGEYRSAFTGDVGETPGGGLQGFLMTKSFAEEWGITTVDDLNNNPDALAAFDAADPVPNNGVADIYGCEQSFTCDDIIQNQIAFGDGSTPWENITQTIAGYDAMAAEATAKANNDEPMLIYTWTPSAYITTLIPGENVVWLGTEAVLDDSNPADLEGGESHDQRPGTANIDAAECPYAADNDNCQLGWIAADIVVTANTEFVEANPAAAALFSVIELSVLEVSLANVAQAGGADTNEAIRGLAADWIADNRDTVDGWLDTARAAAG